MRCAVYFLMRYSLYAPLHSDLITNTAQAQKRKKIYANPAHKFGINQLLQPLLIASAFDLLSTTY